MNKPDQYVRVSVMTENRECFALTVDVYDLAVMPLWELNFRLAVLMEEMGNAARCYIVERVEAAREGRGCGDEH